MISMIVVGLIKESKLRLPSKVARALSVVSLEPGIEIERFCQNGKLSRAVMIAIGFLWATRR